jgi:hypothetical protein
MLEETKHLIEAPWNKTIRDGLGTRPASLQKSYEMKPETPVADAFNPLHCIHRWPLQNSAGRAELQPPPGHGMPALTHASNASTNWS